MLNKRPALSLLLGIAVSLALTACSPVEYKPVTGSLLSAKDGYMDEEIAPGVHVIEVRQVGGFQFIFNYDATITTFRQHWHRRAKELCPAGYLGEPEVLSPAEARLEAFSCTTRGCQDYPIVSGIAYCHQRYSL